MWEQAEVLLANAARLVDTLCTPEAAALQQQQGAAAVGAAWAGASAAERRCLMVFDVSTARYIAASNLGQQVIVHMLAGKCPASGSVSSRVTGASASDQRVVLHEYLCFPASPA
jgi:hypothetical protein